MASGNGRIILPDGTVIEGVFKDVFFVEGHDQKG
jgi:hypothetical protein